ncbi:hypothetical protein HanRHA438_Chr13g0605941 [Helianthus annuus]|nr:hypothetical protein HanIR_Chr13g0647591 [Helianthus annuus]KAJ0858860.1 hypothetical protein HanRHA438_Chr13g0605941 [Helianthus annuus]
MFGYRLRTDPPLLLLESSRCFCCEENIGNPNTLPDFEHTGTFSTGVTRTFAEYDLSIPLCLNLGPPLKLLGLLELRSKLWKTIFPDEFIRGLSTDTPRVDSDERRLVLRLTRAVVCRC